MKAFVIGAILTGLASSASAADAPAKAPLQPYVQESRISAPRAFEAWSLDAPEHDPAQRLAGVVLRYRDTARPGMKVTFVIHPAGDTPERKALGDEVDHVADTLQTGATRAGYADFRIADRSGFTVKMPRRPAQSTTVAIGPEPAPASGVESVTVSPHPASTEQKLYPQPPLRGHRITATYTDPKAGADGAAPATKFVYVFVRHMYFVRGTITFDGAAPDKAHRAEADRVIQGIVSGFEIENIGRCGDASAYVGDVGAASVGLVFQAMDEMGWRGCTGRSQYATIGTSDARNEVVTIHFEPGDWGGTP